jgi:hypothetical protein
MGQVPGRVLGGPARQEATGASTLARRGGFAAQLKRVEPFQAFVALDSWVFPFTSKNPLKPASRWPMCL